MTWYDNRNKPWVDPLRPPKKNPNDARKEELERTKRIVESFEKVVIEGLEKQAKQLLNLSKLSNKTLTEFLFDKNEELRTTAKDLINQGNTKGPEYSVVLADFYNLVDKVLPYIVKRQANGIGLILTLIAKELDRTYEYLRMVAQAHAKYQKELDKQYEDNWHTSTWEPTWR